jgi:hypothetical protein
MTAATALAVGQALVTTAQAEAALSELLVAPHRRLADAVAALQTTIGKAALSKPTPAGAWPLDRRIDIVLGRQRVWLEGWDFDEPENDRRDAARTLYDVWYGEGAWYVNGTYPEQWAQMAARFELIDEKSLEPLYKSLGGTNHLRALRRLHGEYGQALGITVPGAQESEDPLVAPQFAVLRTRLREWIGKVEATVDEENPDSRRTADRLLAPIAAIEVSPAGAPPAAPVPPAEPETQPA